MQKWSMVSGVVSGFTSVIPHSLNVVAFTLESIYCNWRVHV